MAIRFNSSKAGIILQAAQARKNDIQKMTEGMETGGSFNPEVAKKLQANPEQFGKLTIGSYLEERSQDFQRLLGGKK